MKKIRIRDEKRYLLKSLVKKVGADFVKLPLTEVGYHHGLGRTKSKTNIFQTLVRTFKNLHIGEFVTIRLRDRDPHAKND